MLPDLICHDCAAVLPVASRAWRCDCGGLLDVVNFSNDVVTQYRNSMWRYLDVLPVPLNSLITLGEGLTPLVPDAVSENASFKCDYLQPTGSFKDRGAAVVATLASELNVSRAVIDSSGNAALAMAAYFARAGIVLDVYVPASTSPSKLAQLEAYGALVHLAADREEARLKAQAEADTKFYASHVYHPYFMHGTKTCAYEVWEQKSERLPETIYLPAGNGTMVIGWSMAISEMLLAGMIDSSPRLVLVQAEACAPLVGGEQSSTIAEGLVIASPPRRNQMLDAMRSSHGRIATVTDGQILSAQRELARQGLFVEPTAAAPYAAFLDSDDESDALILLGGTGLKSVSRRG